MDIISQLGFNSIDRVITFVVTLVIVLVAMKVVNNIVHKLMDRTKLDGTIKNIVSTAVKIALWCLAVVIVADSLGISTASLVAVISIAGLALSLSVQDIMSNLFSGIVILMTKTFKKGDFVEIGGNLGVVNSVGLTHTSITTVDNRIINIPNKNVAGANIINYTCEPLRRVDMVYGVDYGCKTEDVTAALNDLAEMDAKILKDPAPFVGILNYGASNIEFTIRAWCKSADYWDVYFGLNNNVREAFKKHGVEMSYDHVNVHVIQ